MPAVHQAIARAVGELVDWNRKPDGWGFGELRTPAGVVGIVGKIVGARRGDTVQIEGVWEETERYGRRIKIKSCTAARPESTEGIVAWMVSTLPDIGEGRARKLIERFGTNLWDVIENTHEALTTVEGITPRRAEAIRDACIAHKAQRDDMIALRGWGLTDNQIAHCVERWGELRAVIDAVRSNHYDLSLHVRGFGFMRADKVATKAGVKHDAPERLYAGIDHVLEEASAAGHCFMWGGALKKLTTELLEVDPRLVEDAIRAAVKAGRVVWRDKRIYSRRMDVAEQQCAASLKRLLEVRV